MKQWIKLYTEVVHDRKLWKLKPIEQLAFFYMLALAGIEDNGGMIPELEDLELELQMPLKLKKDELKGIVSRLESVGLLEEYPRGILKVSQFEKRQMSNQTEAERKAAYRERKRTMSGQVSQECPDNVPERSTLEKEIEIDKEIDINTLSNESVYTPAKKSKPEKQKFGSMQNVLLTSDEYAKLCERFPDADAKIESLSLAIASKGYKYKDHYATVLNWARMDADKAKTTPKPEQPKKTYTFSEIVAMEDAGLI